MPVGQWLGPLGRVLRVESCTQNWAYHALAGLEFLWATELICSLHYISSLFAPPTLSELNALPKYSCGTTDGRDESGQATAPHHRSVRTDKKSLTPNLDCTRPRSGPICGLHSASNYLILSSISSLGPSHRVCAVSSPLTYGFSVSARIPATFTLPSEVVHTSNRHRCTAKTYLPSTLMSQSSPIWLSVACWVPYTCTRCQSLVAQGHHTGMRIRPLALPCRANILDPMGPWSDRSSHSTRLP